jgi:hypothetical protein
MGGGTKFALLDEAWGAAVGRAEKLALRDMVTCQGKMDEKWKKEVR